jgi:hypothetical protein
MKLTDGTITPAYGRDYKSKKAAIEDFEAGKDFVYNKMGEQGYCSIRDFEPGSTIMIRYKKLTMVTPYKVKETMKKILLGIQTVLDGGKYIHYLTLKEIVRVLESIRVLIKEEDLKEFNEFVKKIEEEAERYEIKWR